MSDKRHTPRKTQIINGVEHIACSSCDRMLPADREHFYFQKDRRVDGTPRPHSWCKPCYLTNTGRAEGMRVGDPQVPQAIRFAQRSFLNLAPPREVRPFTGAPLLQAA